MRYGLHRRFSLISQCSRTGVLTSSFVCAIAAAADMDSRIVMPYTVVWEIDMRHDMDNNGLDGHFFE